MTIYSNVCRLTIIVLMAFFALVAPESIFAEGVITPSAANTEVPWNPPTYATTGVSADQLISGVASLASAMLLVGVIGYAWSLHVQKRGSIYAVSQLGITSGLFFLSVIIFHHVMTFQTLAVQASDLVYQPQTKFIRSEKKEDFIPVSLTIPHLLSTTLEPGVFEQNTWQIADAQANYWVDSSLPGWGSNIVIYGHNTPQVFAKLQHAEIGDTISVEVINRQTFEYIITHKLIVEPTDTQYLQPTDDEVLTIYTCIGWLDSKRLIVRARTN